MLRRCLLVISHLAVPCEALSLLAARPRILLTSRRLLTTIGPARGRTYPLAATPTNEVVASRRTMAGRAGPVSASEDGQARVRIVY